MVSRYCTLLLSVLLCVMGLSSARADVLYEYDPGAEILKRHQVRMRRIYFDSGMSEEEIAAKASKYVPRAEAQDTQTLKVELLRDPDEDNRAYVQITYLGKNLIRFAEGQKWREEAAEQLTIRADTGGFRYVNVAAFPERHDSEGPLFFGEMGRAGHLRIEYKGPKGEYVPIHIDHVPEKTIPLAAFVKLMMHEECRLQRTSIGYVMKCRDPQTNVIRVRWLSGDHLAIAISGKESPLEPLVELYGKKFPSTLPRDFEIDRTSWARELVEYALGVMERTLENPATSQNRSLFHSYLFTAFLISGMPV
jgi:hypothetical protein